MINRTHDLLYLQENRYKKPKEAFKFIADEAFINKDLNLNLNICDFGCAAGELLYYLESLSSKFNLNGVELLESLIEKAKKELPNVNFKVGSILDKNIIPKNQFDKSFLSGVLSIFDDFESPINNIINFTKKGGKVYVFGIFNPYPIDVFLKYKLSKNNNVQQELESGWNNFSIESISNFLNKHRKVKNFYFKKFLINIDLKPVKNDSIRSWTFKGEDKSNIITNGLSIIQNQYLLVIEL